MSHVEELVKTLTAYQALPHHADQQLQAIFLAVQRWQKQRIHQSNHALFANPNTAAFAHYLIDRIYGSQDFDTLVDQLLTAGNNALIGSGRLEKLIPKKTLATGILGIKSAILAVELDLQVAQFIRQTPLCHQQYQASGISDEMMVFAYHSLDSQSLRTNQIKDIQAVCMASYAQFDSLLLYQAFSLAKSAAYRHGYQPLYDFIHDGLFAIKSIKNIDDFIVPFTKNELATIERIHRHGRIYDE